MINLIKSKIKGFLLMGWKTPGNEIVNKIRTSLSSTEKAIFYGLLVVFFFSAVNILAQVNKSYLIPVPAQGGDLVEGIIGSPRFVNPLLAVTDTDKDLVSLVYSGLMRTTSSGETITDLASDYKISNDGLVYTFTLKDNLYFHDGVKLTTDDIEFTIKKAQDATLKSPKRPSLYDVKVEKLGDNQIIFRLSKPYAPFLETLSLGIIPKHIWNNFDSNQFNMSQYNVAPVGSGPYVIKKMDIIKKNMLMTPVLYELKPFSKYALGEALIKKLSIKFYNNQSELIKAFNNDEVESISGISPDKIKDLNKSQMDNSILNTSLLPRIFAIFFNQNQSSILSNKEVRLALDTAIDKQKIVDTVLSGYGTTIDGPIPAELLNIQEDKNIIDEPTRIEKAKEILTKAGWKYSDENKVWTKTEKKKTQTLAFSVETSNTEDLMKVSDLIKKDWEKIGIYVEFHPYEYGDLQQNIIRPRKYDALLFGEVIGRDMDMYAYWHSSQRNDPGYNVALYTNSKADKLLEDARKSSDTVVRDQKYTEFYNEIKKDNPAIFLYSPYFTYILPKDINGFKSELTTMPSERLQDISRWYIETEDIWKIFYN